MAETLGTALKRGVGVYAGLAVGLLVTLLVLAPTVQTLAADAEIPVGVTDAHLLIIAYIPLVTGLALLGAFVTGLDLGRRQAGDTSQAAIQALAVGVVGVVLLVILGFVGLKAAIPMIKLEEEATTVSTEGLAFSLLLIVPVVITSLVTAIVSARFADEAPRRRERPAPEPAPEPEPAAAGTENPEAESGHAHSHEEPIEGTEIGPLGSPAEAESDEPEADVDTKQLRCPSCSTEFETDIRPGEDIVCPDCGYTASSTA